jgi:hypothetical protein
MRLRIGLVAGFAAGAYVATYAQKRSRELNQAVNQRVSRTLKGRAIDAAATKAKVGVERARDVVAAKLGDQGLRPLVQTPSRLAAQQRNGNGTRPS